MTEPAADGHGPGERHGTGRRDPWSAATEPVTEQPSSGEPDPREPGGDSASPRTGPAVGPGPAPRASSTVAPAGGGAAPVRPVRPGREVSRRPAEPGQPRRAESRRPRQQPAGDLLTGVQRWLIRSSAKSMRREIEDQVRRTLGSGRAEPEDVWGTATTEPPPEASTEPPECAWCPICRAARRMRESGPGLGSQISSVSETVAAAVQDAIGTFDGVLSRTMAASGSERPADRSSGSGHADAARDKAERASDEPGDRR